MRGIVFVYITNPSREEALRLASHLLDRRLIACGNVWPITSVYTWEDKVENEEEFALIAKTTEEAFEALRAEVEKEHSYSVPCIVKLPASANDPFGEWVHENVSVPKA